MPDDTKTSEELAAEEASAKLAEEEAAKKAAEEDASDDDADVLSDKEKKAIGESKKYQKRAQKAEKELDKIREDKLSEDEKKDLKLSQEKDRADKAESDLKDSKLDTLIMGYASTLGFQDLDVVKLIALKELDDVDEVSKEDVKAVIDSIAKEKPYLLGGNDTTDVGKGNFKGGTKIDSEKTADELLKDVIVKGVNF